MVIRTQLCALYNLWLQDYLGRGKQNVIEFKGQAVRPTENIVLAAKVNVSHWGGPDVSGFMD